jgi:tetratricopeptide (TPR) repeat protein
MKQSAYFVASPGVIFHSLLLLWILLSPSLTQAAGVDDYAARVAQAQALVKQGEDAAAAKIYEDLIKQEPGQPQAYNNLAAIKARHGEYKQAQALLERALRSNPVYATVYENLSAIYVEMARDSYGKALRLEAPQQTVVLRELTGPKQAKPAQKQIAVATAQKQPAPVVNATSKAVAKQDRPIPAATASGQAQQSPPLATVAKTEPPPQKATTPPPVAMAKTPAAPVNAPARTEATAKAAPQMAAAETAPVTSSTDAHQADTSSATNATVLNKDEVITNLQAWAAAWSDQAVDLYVGFYSDKYAPRGMTHQQWLAQRHQRLTAPQWIQVALNDFQIGPVKGDVVRVRFIQEYKADNYQDRTRKQVRLRHTPDGWRIVEEKTLEKLR